MVGECDRSSFEVVDVGVRLVLYERRSWLSVMHCTCYMNSEVRHYVERYIMQFLGRADLVDKSDIPHKCFIRDLSG